MKLLIGNRGKVPGWLTLDMQGGADVIGNCQRLPFVAGVFETIYCSHVLEHLSYNRGVSLALKEWFRVLEANGTLMVSVPDFGKLCRMFCALECTTEDRVNIMRMIFGGHLDAYDEHRAGLTWEFLWAFMSDAGFVEIRRVPDFNVIAGDASSFSYAGVPVSLNVIATKTGAHANAEGEIYSGCDV